MPFSSKKEEFDRCFNRLDRLVEKSLPDQPVDSTGASQPDRFPLIQPAMSSSNSKNYFWLKRRYNLDIWE